MIIAMKTYSTVKVAKMLGVGRDTLYRWMRSGKIRGSRVARFGDVKLRLWTESDVARIREYMKTHPYKGRGEKRVK